MDTFQKFKATPENIFQKFFDSSNVTNPFTKRMIKELASLDRKQPFVEKVIANGGYPRWDKIITQNKNAEFGMYKTLSSASNSQSEQFSIIPLVSEKNDFITGAIIVNGSDTFSYHVTFLNHYKLRGNESEEYVQAMMQLNFKIFKHSEFKILDSTLFGGVKTAIMRKENVQNIARLDFPVYDPCTKIGLWFDPDGASDPYHNSGNEIYTGLWYYAGECNEQPEAPRIVIIPGDGGSNAGDYYPLPDLSGLGDGGGFDPPPFTPVETTFEEKVTYVSEQLSVDQNSIDWLENNPPATDEIYNYLFGQFTQERLQLAKEHLARMISDDDYNNFVISYRAYYMGNNKKMWWEDDNWLSNPNNFTLSVNDENEGYDKLTEAEKNLIVLYPVQAFVISKNVQNALNMSHSKMGPVGGLNDKKDAFRHGYFNAINTRDVPARVYPVMIFGSSIVKQFGIAHESEVPPQLDLEKQMDLFNNDKGINYCWNCIPLISTDNSIADAIFTMVTNGELLYIDPLNFILSPRYDDDQDGVQDCLTCLNGIIDTTSILKPTNQ